jgi:clorobiocin biosynthesis protein CloN5
MTVISESQIRHQVQSFIGGRFLDGDPDGELKNDTELLPLGILNSLNTVVLVTFIREQFSVRVPPAAMSARNFGSVSAIAAMITGLLAGLPDPGG